MIKSVLQFIHCKHATAICLFIYINRIIYEQKALTSTDDKLTLRWEFFLNYSWLLHIYREQQIKIQCEKLHFYKLCQLCYRTRNSLLFIIMYQPYVVYFKKIIQKAQCDIFW